MKDCTDVSYVAREGVELTVHKESLVVCSLLMIEIILELGYSHAVMHLADFRGRS